MAHCSDQRKREMDAEALQLSVPGVAGQYVWFMSGKTIDLFDLQGLQLDLMHAAHEGTAMSSSTARACWQSARPT